MPIRYTPDVEQISADEATISAEITETLLSISRETYRNSGQGLRSVHAKSHALLTGEMRVLDNLPSYLAQGLFATPGAYPVVMRFSTTPGDILPDSVSTPHGLAVKVFDVPGERLEGHDDDRVQDFVMVNAPAFQTPDGRAFLANLRLLAATTDRAEGAKVALSAVLRNAEKVMEAFGGETPLRALGGEVPKHPAGETYYSQAPIRYGDYIAKVSVAPASGPMKALTGTRVGVSGRDLALREAMTETFAHQGGEWELRVQVCTDLKHMPVENAAVVWDEALSPFIPVARLSVPAQPAWTQAAAETIDRGMSFNPWHALAAHRPLGSIMRLRQKAYAASVQFRQAQANLSGD